MEVWEEDDLPPMTPQASLTQDLPIPFAWFQTQRYGGGHRGG